MGSVFFLVLAEGTLFGILMGNLGVNFNPQIKLKFLRVNFYPQSPKKNPQPQNDFAEGKYIYP